MACINRKTKKSRRDLTIVYFLRNEQPSVSLAFPPVGWQRTVEQPAQITTVCACEKTVVMVKQPGHLTSMKKDRGAGTRVCEGIVSIYSYLKAYRFAYDADHLP